MVSRAVIRLSPEKGRAFNRKGDFDNLGDTADGLREILEESFQTVEVDVIGRSW